jgi:hypothetical protein
MNLRAFVEKTPKADILREMIGFTAERLMGLCHGNLICAAGNPEAAAGSHEAVAARHVGSASPLRTRSVPRDVRWRWTLKVLWTAA